MVANQLFGVALVEFEPWLINSLCVALVFIAAFLFLKAPLASAGRLWQTALARLRGHKEGEEDEAEQQDEAESIERFCALLPRVLGLIEQVNEGNVDPGARTALAEDLEALLVFPRAIRRERGEASLGPELAYLRRCMTATEDYLSLPVARMKFTANGPQDELDYDRDAIGAIWDENNK